MKYTPTVPHAFCVFLFATLAGGCAPEKSEPPTASLPLEGVETIAPEEPPQADEHASASFYCVDHYDEARDPNKDLVATIARAGAEDKRILLQIGGDWCGWCARISNYMATDERIRGMLEESFLVMKVTYPGEHSETFLSQYPKVVAYPHFFVLEKDGSLLHSQGTGELEEGEGYNQQVFADFLSAWIP